MYATKMCLGEIGLSTWKVGCERGSISVVMKTQDLLDVLTGDGEVKDGIQGGAVLVCIVPTGKRAIL
jgi:hypothetical protein